jgi:hypothetical protein
MLKENCVDWLTKKLADNAIFLCEDVRKEAKEAGYSKDDLKKARKELGVKTFHQFDESGATQNWFWHL